MRNFFATRSFSLTIIFLFLASVQLMSLSVKDPSISRFGYVLVSKVFGPFEKVKSNLSASIDNVWSRYVWLVGLRDEVIQLSSELTQLRSDSAQLEELETENHRLRGLLNFSKGKSAKPVAAAVIGRNYTSWVHSITIDRGSQHGLTTGLPVVNGKTIVGQVIAVSKLSSKVLLLTDKSSSVDTIVQPSRTPGIAEGTFEDGLELKYVTHDFQVDVGNTIISSGMDGVFPKGLIVGVVKDIRPTPSSLFQKIKVKPVLDIRKLETVLVLMPIEIVNLPNEQRKGSTSVPIYLVDKSSVFDRRYVLNNLRSC